MHNSNLSQVANKWYLAKHYFYNALLCDINTMPLIYSRWYINNGNEIVNPQVKQNFSKNIHCQVCHGKHVVL